MTAPTRFEDRLLAQLRQIVAERPAPAATPHRRPRRTRLALAGAGVAAAAAAAVAIVATGGGVTPAYAVQPRADGSVTVRIHSLSDAAGLERRLRAAGVPAVVDYTTGGPGGCVGPGPVTETGPTETIGGSATGPTHSTGGEAGSGTGPSTSGPGPGPGDGATTSSTRIDAGGVTFTIDPGHIATGQKVYITTSGGSTGSLAMAITSEKPGTAC
jgi:hypothetical protein